MESSKKNKRNRNCIPIKYVILISYLMSIISNSILVTIIYLMNLWPKYFGYLIHFLIFLSVLSSLKHLLFPSGKIIKRYIFTTKLFTGSIMCSTVYYIVLFGYMFLNKLDLEVSFFYAFCLLIWSVYHYLFISIIFSYILAISDRPEQDDENSGPKVDKELQDMMLKDIKK